MAAQLDMAWIGIDVGKTHHWVCVGDADSKVLLSAKVANEEAEIVALIADAASLATRLVWAVDIIGAPSALLLALLAQAGQPVRYASGRVVAAMSDAYAGEGKTDAKDSYVIAETVRLRRDLATIDADTDLVRNLAVLTGHRADLIADRVRMINRLRDLMTSVFPSLERAFDYSSHKGALAAPAVTAAKAQSIVLPGQEPTASIIAELASGILALDERLKALDARIDETFRKTLGSNNSHLLVTMQTKATRAPASDGYIKNTLRAVGVRPRILRSTRLVDLAGTIDPKLVATAYGMHREAVTAYLAEQVDTARLPDDFFAEPTSG